jgi:hypothetical protein
MDTTTKSELAHRAHRELVAARDALARAQALFQVLRQAAVNDNADLLDLYGIADVGLQVSAQYSERADGEAAYFKETANTPVEGE